MRFLNSKRLPKSSFCCWLILSFSLLFAGTGWAQPLTGTSDREALTEDAISYARTFDVDEREALRRLELQGIIGELEVTLAAREADSFAGLWIDNGPDFRVVVASTSPVRAQAQKLVESYVAASPLAGLVEVRSARYTQQELLAARSAAFFATRALGLSRTPDAGIDVKANRAELYVIDRGELETGLRASGLDLPAAVRVVEVDDLSQDEVIYGGLPISTCTTGFSVVAGNGVRGVLTAAHCGNSQSYSGSSLTYQGQSCGGSQDVQWHTSSTHTVTNQFKASSGTRNCTGTVSRSSQSVGGYVCKQGKTTGYTCGTISDKSFLPSSSTCSTHNATFIRVEGGSTDLSSGGDSGGPWFLGNSAYGIHKCGIGNDSCYQAINYISALGVSVLTY